MRRERFCRWGVIGCRPIGGNARAVFDYFIGYKLGLTATPRDYLKKFNQHTPTTRDPREFERRLLLDTYRTYKTNKPASASLWA